MIATIILLLKLRLINELALAGLDISNPSFDQARVELIVHAAGGILLLVIATVLSIYKPKWLTPHGRKKFGILAILIIKHVMDGGLKNH